VDYPAGLFHCAAPHKRKTRRGALAIIKPVAEAWQVLLIGILYHAGVAVHTQKAESRFLIQCKGKIIFPSAGNWKRQRETREGPARQRRLQHWQKLT
jgi:hypothetical protein